MISLNRRNIALVFMLAWLILSPYALTTGNITQSYNPIDTMKLAAPTITGPSLFEFENGSVGLTIVYDASDPNPKNYTVTLEGEQIDVGDWSGGEITVYVAWIYQRGLIDTLPKELTLVVTVFNDQGESASATTTVRAIQDETAPIVESYYIRGSFELKTSNFTYEVGSFGHEILWNVSEANPDFYNITRTSNESGTNYTEIESGPYDGSDITLNVDGLNVSRWYLYSLFVNDTFGRNSTNYMNVTISPDLTDPTITSPDDISFEFGDEGYEILWQAYDSNPKNYTINAMIHYNDTTYGNVTERHTFIDVSEPNWTFSDLEGLNISVVVDNLFLGNYTITITLFDDFDRMTNDSVNVTIYRDIRPPVITSSGDFSYEEGYTGYSINWTIEENNPKFFNLTLNGDVYDNGTWRGEDYVLSVDRLPVGSYIYNMTYTDFFNQSAFSMIEVEVTPDVHPPIIAEVRAFQTFTTRTANNLSIHASAWDINNISSIEVQWGVGDPEAEDFEYETQDMLQSEIENIFTAKLGEYQHGIVVWFKITAHDNSSVHLELDSGWISVEITSQGIDRVPAILYAAVVIFGSLALLVIFVLYFRTRTR